MSAVRAAVLVLLLVLAMVLQVSVFSFFAYDQVVPNLVLLVVVGAALTRGPEVAAALGFVGGLLIDLAPPADHVAGRWALALTVVGYVAGRVRQDASRSTVVALVTVAAASFVGTSVFALSGMLLGDTVTSAEALRVIPEALIYDLLLAPFVLPLVLRLSRRELPQSRVVHGGVR